jgi:RNA polymerase sigma factor for flagellar operon FliA
MTAQLQTAPAARNRLILDHLDMAKRIALKVARRVPGGKVADDLVAAAYLGLTQAADRYDPVAGPFVAFAEKRIRGAVLDELRRADVLSHRRRAKARKARDVSEKLEKQLGRTPDATEIADGLGVSLECYRTDYEALAHAAVVPLIDEGLRDNSSEDVAEATERRRLIAVVAEQIAKLPERQRNILALYHIEGLTHREIGDMLGVTESRVCQIRTATMTQIRDALTRCRAIESGARFAVAS